MACAARTSLLWLAAVTVALFPAIALWALFVLRIVSWYGIHLATNRRIRERCLQPDFFSMLSRSASTAAALRWAVRVA